MRIHRETFASPDEVEEFFNSKIAFTDGILEHQRQLEHAADYQGKRECWITFHVPTRVVRTMNLRFNVSVPWENNNNTAAIARFIAAIGDVRIVSVEPRYNENMGDLVLMWIQVRW